MLCDTRQIPGSSLLTTNRLRALSAAAMFATVPGPCSADVLINQAAALKGNVTPGDAPGFPVTLNVPGTFRLVGNLLLTDVNMTAIQISVNDVTLDLGGFRIKGPVVCSQTPTSCNNNGAGVGISAAARRDITVFNGIIRGMGSDAIQTGPSARIEKVHAVSNGGFGISAGDDSLVNDNTVGQNGAGGIFVAKGGLVTGNRVSNNASDGIVTDTGSVVTGNVARSNSGSGISTAQHNTISGNAVTANSGYGILTNASTLDGNTVASNQGTGVDAGSGSMVGNNTVADNTLVANQSTLVGNAAVSNQDPPVFNVLTSQTMLLGNFISYPKLDTSGYGNNAFSLGYNISYSKSTDCNFFAEANKPGDYVECPP